MNYLENQNDSVRVYGDEHLKVDFERGVVLLDSKEMKLTRKERELFLLLVANTGRSFHGTSCCLACGGTAMRSALALSIFTSGGYARSWVSMVSGTLRPSSGSGTAFSGSAS